MNLAKFWQINYVQHLWDIILATSNEGPFPDWHLEIVRQRAAAQATAKPNTCNEATQGLMNKYCDH